MDTDLGVAKGKSWNTFHTLYGIFKELIKSFKRQVDVYVRRYWVSSSSSSLWCLGLGEVIQQATGHYEDVPK